MLPITLRLTLGLALIIYFALIFIFLKNKAIELKYTLLWLLAGFCMAVLVIFPKVLPWFIHLFGITDNMNGLFMICISFLMMIVMALTSIVSRQSAKLRELTQNQALLEREIRLLGRSEEESDGKSFTDSDNL